MKKLIKIRDLLFFAIFFIPMIILALLFFGVLEIVGVIKIKGRNNIPHNSEGLLVISNHESFYEPIVLGYVFIKQIIANPIKNFPYSCPDFNNFNKWWWATFKERFIFFPRGEKRKCAIAFARAVCIIKKMRIIIIHPEGGRTGTNKTNKWYTSENGYRLRPFASGAMRLALETHCEVLPIWVRGFDKAMPIGSKLPKIWKKIEIHIGPTFKLEADQDGEKIFVEKLFQIADKL